MNQLSMKLFKYLSSALLLFSIIAGCQGQQEQTVQSPVSYVDPFIGTGGHGHVYPGATVPFGMVQVSPDNGKSGWDYSSGYHYPDGSLAGFSMTHLSGTGIGDLSDLSFMPFSGTDADTAHGAVYSTYMHENESAEPGYYSVKMDNGIQVDLTASKRVGFYRYMFPDNADQAVSLDLGFAINWDQPTETSLKVVNDTLVTGYRFSKGWAKDQRVYFAAVFSKPISHTQVENEGKIISDPSELKGKTTHGFFFFENNDDALMQKVAISAVSIENAEENLQAEVPGWDFDEVRNKAHNHWVQQLNKIKVAPGDKADLRTFYTSLYHTMLAPTLYMDVNGEYRGADMNVHKAEDGLTSYSTFSLWDTYRAEHPLLTFLEPDRINGMIKFMLAFYDQHGLLPVWELKANETNTMIGYHAIPVITDAYFKGFRDFDVEKAFDAMKKSATQQNDEVETYVKKGYVPSDKFSESVSKTLEYAYDDWCIAQMAKALGKDDDYSTYSKRAQNYRNLYDESTGFMRPKLANGEWETPFDPYAAPTDFSKRNYTEANAWQYLWYVPQDVSDLANLMGGTEEFVSRLDTLFNTSPEVKEGGIADMSGLIGQYVQGNEPDQQTPYMYDYAGAPWKTQRIIRTIADSLYKDTPNGLPGNEDCGQMSAWYVFTALGFYPVNPANGVYAIGSPMFPKASIDLGNGKKFVVEAHGVSEDNKFIQSATLNGETYDKPYITYQDIKNGSTLVLQMGPEPNKEWGASEENQPSLTAFGSSSNISR